MLVAVLQSPPEGPSEGPCPLKVKGHLSTSISPHTGCGTRRAPSEGMGHPTTKNGVPQGQPQCWQLLHMGCGVHCDPCEGMGPSRG